MVQSPTLPKPYTGANRTVWWKMAEVTPDWNSGRWIGLHWEYKQFYGAGWVWVAAWWTYGDKKHHWWESWEDTPEWNWPVCDEASYGVMPEDYRSRPY